LNSGCFLTHQHDSINTFAPGQELGLTEQWRAPTLRAATVTTSLPAGVHASRCSCGFAYPSWTGAAHLDYDIALGLFTRTRIGSVFAAAATTPATTSHRTRYLGAAFCIAAIGVCEIFTDFYLRFLVINGF
jgi:hypothetical protein